MILLIGGNSGMGLATARLLLKQGDTVIAAARSSGPLEEIGIPVQSFDALNPGALSLPPILDGDDPSGTGLSQVQCIVSDVCTYIDEALPLAGTSQSLQFRAVVDLGRNQNLYIRGVVGKVQAVFQSSDFCIHNRPVDIFPCLVEEFCNFPMSQSEFCDHR